MDDKFRAIEQELVEGFILREYSDRYGVMTTDFRDKAISLYWNDPMFHARVNAVVAGVMQIVARHIDS